MTTHQLTTVTDKRGKRFHIYEDDEVNRILLYRPLVGAYLLIGWANYVMKEASTLILADIQLLEMPQIHRDGVYKYFPRWLWRKSQRESYRGRGLGSALIEAVVGFARSNGLQRIEGFIVERDYHRNPHLPSLYENHGFAVRTTPPEVREQTSKVAEICLTLDPVEKGELNDKV